MTEFEALLRRYEYPLSEKLIALEPANPRDSSKVLVYSRSKGSIVVDTFRNLPRHLPTKALLIFNDTKVIPARIPAHLSSGGKIELLCTKFEGNEIDALCERYLPDGTVIAFTDSIFATVLRKNGSEYRLRLDGSDDIRPLLLKLGTTPLPPYLKNSPLTEQERREKYQAIFAKQSGSIAAPTASLHFTPYLMESLEKEGVETAFVTLHVNLGTFMPLTADAITRNELHEEYFEIPEETLIKIKEAKETGRPVIAVGTTALRAVESSFSGKTDSTRLFIREGYTFKATDGLITNFHVPRSSLMMLVAALVGREKLLELYDFAIKNDFRFLSFGDGMLIL